MNWVEHIWDVPKARCFDAHEGCYALSVRQAGAEGWCWSVLRKGSWFTESTGPRMYEPTPDHAKAMAELFMRTWQAGYDAVAASLEDTP